jgi:type II restriction/modification system DNA methylase subunit YeeA
MANLPQTEFPFNLPRQSSNFFFTTVPPPYQKYQLLIKDNTGKEIKYGTPKGCDTGILKDSEELQAIIKKDWGKLEQLSSNFFFTTASSPDQKYQLLHRLTPPSVWRVFGLVCFV